MIAINFYPESDNDKFTKAAAEYTKIWQENGGKIIEEIEKISKLKFKTKVINAVTYEGFSHSYPLKLRSSYPRIHKEATLIHELCHRLLMDNSFYMYDSTNKKEDVHKIIDLILFDIWVELIGPESANECVQTEIGYGDSAYTNAWNWALSLSTKERRLEFEKYKAKYSNYKRGK